MNLIHSSGNKESTSLAVTLIEGTSVMASNIRCFDWASTAIGPIGAWSRTLLTQVNRMLKSQYPTTLLWDSEMIFFYNDATIPTLFGKHPSALGRPSSQVFEDVWDLVMPECQACFLAGETIIRENVSMPVWRDGRLEHRFFTYFSNPVYEDDQVVAQYAVHHDTTDLVRVVAERDALAAQLAQALDATSDGVVNISRDWVITYMNHAAVVLLGPESTIVGSNNWERFPRQVYPDSPFVSTYERAMNEGIAGHFEAFYPEPLNVWVGLEVRPASDGIAVFIKDLTEQRSVEDMLRKGEDRERRNLAELFEQAPVFIAFLGGPEHIFESVNENYRKLLGDRELIGRRVVDCVPEVAGTGWIDLLDNVYRTGEPAVAQGARVSLAAGPGKPLDDKYIDYIYHARREPSGSISGIIALGVDTSLAAEVLNSTSDGILMLDRNWCVVYLNPHAVQLVANGRALVGRNLWEEFPAAIGSLFWDNYHLTMEHRIATEFVAYYPAPLERWYEVHTYPTYQGISAFFRDVTVKRAADERLRLLEQTVAAAPIGITLARYESSHQCPLIYVNPAFERLTGYTAEEAMGIDCRFLQGTDLHQEGKAGLQSAIDNGKPGKVLLRNYRKNGELFFNEVHVSQVYDEHGKISHIIGIQNDVTDQVQTKDQLANQARHDALTGLANRYVLVEQLESALDKGRRDKTQVAVIILDLDNFKHMNDRFGHVEADRILVQTSRRLNALADKTGTAARFGGDEFAIILSDWEDLGQLEKQMERLLLEIRKPIQLGNSEVMLTGSVGIAIFPQDAADPEELLQMADLSMYWIKRCGKNSFRFYSPDLRFNENEPLDVAVGFRTALAYSQFELFYQPRVSADAKQVTGCEALIRWNHPERGLLYPAQFVRIAEDTGLINEIGRWVLEEALRQNAAWRAAGYPPICMSINVSASQMRDPTFPVIVADALSRTGVPADSLELELTESLIIDNAFLAEGSLLALKKLGVRIAIDDFGTGYSGLQYLSRFPVDTIKIDQFFTKNIATDHTAATICRSVFALGRDLGLTTVAEGVESQEQALLLQSWNCSELQGYLFARPFPASAAGQMFQIHPKLS